MEIINTDNFTEKVLDNDNLTVVDFYADWCPPCQMMGPIFEEVAKENKDISFYKINIDNDQSIASQYGVMSIPTFIVFENKKVKDIHIGGCSKKELEDFILKR